MRVAVIDIGTNSTRLLVADVGDDGRVTDLERRSTVTRLGEGVDASGRLADAAMDRVTACVADYRAIWEDLGAERLTGVLTSAVRDAANGAEFTERIRRDFAIDARTIPGEEEAQLTYLGATSERPADDTTPTVLVDIGGGSTELVVGTGREVTFFVSTQAGVVRQGERFIAHDPPAPDELVAVADEVRAIFHGAVPAAVRASVTRAIAVAGTATSLAAIDLELDPYDPAQVHGHHLLLGRIEELLARLAQMDLAERRRVTGLHPDRAPTIVAGCVLLVEALRTFGLDAMEVSEHDILRGAALAATGHAPG